MSFLPLCYKQTAISKSFCSESVELSRNVSARYKKSFIKTNLGITIEKKLASARLMFCGLGLLIMDFIT